MNTGGTITACALVGLASMAGVQAVSHAELGWKDVLGGGAAGMVIFVVILFLKSIAEMRKEHGDTVGKVSADFSEAVKASTKEFAESTQKIIEGSRAHNQANLAMLQQIIQNLHETR